MNAGHRYEGSPLLAVENLVKYFPVKKGVLSRTVGHVKAVDGVSFVIWQGETMGLVGESGCGKTTLGKTVIRLLEPTSGRVVFKGTDICSLSSTEMRKLRRHVQMVFQDPYASLNPRMTAGQIIGEPLSIHGVAKGKEKEERVAALLMTVGLDPRHIRRYPHEFSGGQRQRIGIARALAVQPELIVCDEPVSALDVSIQSQIINLLVDLQEQFGFTYLFVSHDLSVIRHISDRVGVMYLGKLVEVADANELFSSPLHPYTEALLSAIPVPDPEAKKRRTVLTGDVPSPINVPEGCRFNTRCRYSQPGCKEKEPSLSPVSESHYVACYLHECGS